MSCTRKSGGSTRRYWGDQHRFEHWYRDNQVYFISARCRERYPAFAIEQAKAVFWDRFLHYTAEAQFVPWVAALLDNHYHVVGYCRIGDALGPMMRKLHGSVAKLVNDILEAQRAVVPPPRQPHFSGPAKALSASPHRLLPFWREGAHKDYFDGCLRNERQCRLAYAYTLRQAVRAGLVRDWRDYPHPRVWIELEAGVRRALELKAFLEGVPYKRYMRGREHGH